MEEQNPDNPERENTTEPISQSDSEQTTQPTEPQMEVHHHTHEPHGKKTWKNYFWEFMMLFLAVFCGFMAEWQLEHTIEHSREKEFIKSLVEDAKIDTANYRIAILRDSIRVEKMDSLTDLCFAYDATGKLDPKMYELYIYALFSPSIVTPTERTMLQLKNAGGMRLIKSKTAIDTILTYDDLGKKLHDQLGFYERSQERNIELGAELFNFRKFRFGAKDKQYVDLTTGDDPTRLLSTDKAKLVAFANTLTIYSEIVKHHTIMLHRMEAHARKLIGTLEKEYDLDE